MKFITLLTDFGEQDGYPGIMKGVIWTIAPDAQIADITHLVKPQQILEGALTLSRAAPFFPAGTVHICVVDPGVGTQRRPIAARLGDQYFVGPDNGLFSIVLQKAQETHEAVQIVHLNQPRYWLPAVSNVFHGRDIFAPAGAHLANGVALEEMGIPIRNPVLLEIPKPRLVSGGVNGQVIHVDSFGNLATNLERKHIQKGMQVSVRIADHTITEMVRAFGDGKPGDLVALIDSAGKLSIAVVNGSAARLLSVGTGEKVELLIQKPSTSKNE